MVIIISRIILLVNMAYLVVKGDWLNVVVLLSGLAITFIPYIMKRWLHTELTQALSSFIVLFGMLSQWLGTYMRAYDYLFWWDILLHGLSGILISLFGIILLIWIDKEGVVFKHKLNVVISIFMFLTGAASAVFWEIFEYTGDTFFGTNAQLGSLVDTMEDMIICVVVSGVFSVLVYFSLHRNKRGFFVRQIEELVTKNYPR